MTEPVIEKGKFHPWEPGYWGQEMKKPPEQKAEEVKPTKFHPWEPGYWDGVKPPKTPIAAPKPASNYSNESNMKREASDVKYSGGEVVLDLASQIDKGSISKNELAKVMSALEKDISTMTPEDRKAFSILKGRLNAQKR